MVAAADLLEARQMQALSLAVHIPLVCFGIAFPAMLLFVEGLYLRTGDPTYKALAKRWSKVALTLFAVGVVTGTILSFEFGLLWPEFMARFGEVFGIGFALEGISFFVEAIFIAIYVYGWDRLSRRAHFLTGIPVVLSGFAGSFNVIAVNGWMNDPTGFDLGPERRGAQPAPVGRAAELEHVARADPHVPGGLPRLRVHRRRRLRLRVAARAARPLPPHGAGRDARVRLAVRAGAGHRRRLGGPRGRAAPAGQARRDGGAAAHAERGAVHARRLLRRGARRGPVRHRDPEAALAARQARPERARSIGLDSVPPEDRPPVNIVRFAFQTMVGIGTFLALLGVVFVWTWYRKRRLPRSPWFFRAVMAAGPLSFVALIAGWITTEVGRQPWIVYEVMRTEEAVTEAGGLAVGYVVLIAVYVALGVAVVWLLRRLARTPPESEVAADAA